MSEFLGLRYTLPVTVQSIDNDNVMESRSFKRRVVRRPGQYWRFTLGLEPVFLNAQQAYSKFLAHQSEHSKSETFEVPVPNLFPADSLAGQAPVPYTAGAEAGLLRIALPLASAMHGRLVKFAGRSKVYIVASAEAVGTTHTDLRLYPQVGHSDAAADGNLVLDGVMAKVRYRPSGDFSVTIDRNAMMVQRVVWDEAV